MQELEIIFKSASIFRVKLKWVRPISAAKNDWQLLPSAAPIRPRRLVSTLQGDRDVGSK